MAWIEGGGLPTPGVTASCPRCEIAARRIAALETALYMIRDREWVENALDPQWAAQVARDALKED